MKDKVASQEHRSYEHGIKTDVWMERSALEAIRAAGLQAPKADLSSFTTWGYENSSQAATITDEFLVSQMPCGPQGHPGQPGQENGGHRRNEIPLSHPSSRSSIHPETLATSSTCQKGLDTQARNAGEARVRDSGHVRPRPSSSGETRT